jgi:predicted PurR-regulated permease PerM
MIISKAVKLHPVTVVVGLLIFGSFFGMFGLIIAAPVIAMLKSILAFLQKKYNFLSSDKHSRRRGKILS